MAKKTKKRKKGSAKHQPKNNPMLKAKKHWGGGYKKKNYGGGRKKKRNPAAFGLGSGINLLKQGLYALIGLVLTRQLPQFALGTRNEGPIGYLANVVTATLVGLGMGQLLGPDAARAGVLGGGLYTVNRLIGDYVSPVQKYLSLTGIGDPMAAGTLRGIEGGYFPLPVPLTAGGLPIIPSEIRAAPAMIAAAATESMGRVGGGGRYGGRW